MTRAELADTTRMSAPTLQRALADLREQGLIEAKDGHVSGGVVNLGRKAGLIVGVDLGRAHRRASVANAHGALLGDPVERDLSDTPDEFGVELLTAVAELVIEAVEKANTGTSPSEEKRYALGDIRSIGIGIPIPVSPYGVTVGMFAPELSGLPLSDVVKSLLERNAKELGTSLHPHLKVRFAKDGDLGALALWRERVQEGLSEAKDGRDYVEYSIVFLKASYGLDAGMICHGLLVSGGRGLAGQIGHMWLPRLESPLESAIYGGVEEDDLFTWPTDRCPRCNRRLCLENVASGRAILRQIHENPDGGEAPRTVQELVRHLNTRQTERQAIRSVVIRAAKMVGVVLADAVRLADPTRIVVGGLLAQAGDTFMTPLRIAFAEAGFPGLEPEIVAVEDERITRVELEGAVALALKHTRFDWQ